MKGIWTLFVSIFNRAMMNFFIAFIFKFIFNILPVLCFFFLSFFSCQMTQMMATTSSWSEYWDNSVALFSLHLIQSAPLELHTPCCSWNMWRCPEKSWGCEEEHATEAPGLSSLTVLLFEGVTLLPQWRNVLLLAPPSSPLSGYIFLCHLCLMKEVSGTTAAITVSLLSIWCAKALWFRITFVVSL